jgi:hypothetical protein
MYTAVIGCTVAAGVAMVLGGCGGSGGASTVASVQGVGIARASLVHRMSIENAQLQGPSAQIPVPDPPGYKRCIAAAGAVQVLLKNRRQLTPKQLRRQCARVYVQLTHKALAFLITADWLQSEAAARGISVLPSEVNATYQQLLSSPTGSAFANHLRQERMSSTDELLQLRLVKLAERLRSKLATGYDSVSPAQIAAYYRSHSSEFTAVGRRHKTLAATTQTIHQRLLHAAEERRVSAFIAEYRRRWKRRTTCQSGYIVPECRNGPPLPASPNE